MFAGFSLSGEGYQIDQSITEAISQFPTPTNLTDLCSFIGSAYQLLASTESVAMHLAPLCPLNSTKNEFIWSANHDQAFNTAKGSLTMAPTLSFFDASKPTRLCTDASRHGLGFILQQKTMTLGPSSKQDLASSQTLSLDMSSLNLNYSLPPGPS